MVKNNHISIKNIALVGKKFDLKFKFNIHSKVADTTIYYVTLILR